MRASLACLASRMPSGLFCREKLCPGSSLFAPVDPLLQPDVPAYSPNILALPLPLHSPCSLQKPLSLSVLEYSFTRFSSSSMPFAKLFLRFSVSEIFSSLSPPSPCSSKLRRQLAVMVDHWGFKGIAISTWHLECESQSEEGRDEDSTSRTQLYRNLWSFKNLHWEKFIFWWSLKQIVRTGKHLPTVEPVLVGQMPTRPSGFGQSLHTASCMLASDLLA